MLDNRISGVIGALVLFGNASCSQITVSEPTPIPGAAATAARAERTPIPTPHPASASPSGAVSPSVAPSPSPGARSAAAPITDEQVEQIRNRVQSALAAEDVSGLEALFFQQVSVATAEGGLQLSQSEALRWLQERIGPGIRVLPVERSALAVALQVPTEGWPASGESPAGKVIFNLHRFAASGQQDEERGEWKIDVVSVS